MDLIILHLYMELTAAACLLFIAWINIRYNATGVYSNLMAVGTTIAAIADIAHSVIPMLYPDIAQQWLVVSWGVSRVTLIVMFFMVLLCYDVVECRLINLAIVLATPLIFAGFMAASLITGAGGDGFHWNVGAFELFGITIHCKLDFILLILWLVTAIFLRKNAHILFPPHVYWLFMSQGIMVHAIMSFSDPDGGGIASFLAHGLKISEYYSFILIYLLYKSTLDRRSDTLYTPRLSTNRINSENSNTIVCEVVTNKNRM